jgi:hypothetical protein
MLTNIRSESEHITTQVHIFQANCNKCSLLLVREEGCTIMPVTPGRAYHSRW